MKSSHHIQVEPPEVWAEAAATAITTWLHQDLLQRKAGRVHVALSGGSTPVGVYLAMTAIPHLDWSRVELYLSDERVVPLDDQQSNYRSARVHLVDRLAPSPLLHPVATELDARSAAARYEELIRQRVTAESGGIPEFDLVLLGMGDDGHTASLFPDQPILQETSRLVADTVHPDSEQPRVSFTLPLICAARRTCFLITGGIKAELLGTLLRGDQEDHGLPVALAAARARDVTWILDRAAASLIPGHGNRTS